MLATSQVHGRRKNGNQSNAHHELADLRTLTLSIQLDQIDVIKSDF